MTTSKKTCFKCELAKPLSDFYRHRQMQDGYLNKCKECAKADTTKNRRERLEYYTDYDKHRSMQPHRIAARHQYRQTEQGKQAVKRAGENWNNRNPIKRAASVSIGNAVRDGKIVKPNNCEECIVSGVRIHGHHDDYSKPLDVRWLCSKCHRKWHKENGEGLHGRAA